MQRDRVVMITGAAGGMGAALVTRFLANGDTVMATDIRGEVLARLRRNRDAGARLVTATADVSEEGECARVADVAREEAGRLDVLVHCAGYFPIRPFEEMSSDEWRQIIEINLTGVFLMTRAVLPLMKGRGWGRIISYGSAAVFEGVPGQAHYVAAKTGLVGLSRSLARELGQYGITVNVVTPGLTVTPPVRQHFPAELLAQQRQARALQRDEDAEDLVGAVFLLASPDANFITGQMINVDGGKTMY
jgi:NAD(P)-dependent dehydrogenase (short-subunit alcohol dehydrogenase family)